MAPWPSAIPGEQAYRGLKEFRAPIVYGKSEMICEEDEIAILAVGSMVSTGDHVREKLKAQGHGCSLVNLRFAKPIDTEVLDRLAEKHGYMVTMEENVLQGGVGLAITDYVQDRYPGVRLMHIALPDAYVEHGNVSLLREELGIDSDSVLKKISENFLARKTDERAIRQHACGQRTGRVKGEGEGHYHVRHRLCGRSEGGQGGDEV